MMFIKNVVTEENLRKVVAKLKTLPSMRLQNDAPGRKAAVLIPLCTVNGEWSLLFTLRTSHLSSHKGQVSFPGGMQDDTDPTLEETAVRETHEELGIPMECIKVYGHGNFIQGRGNTMVMPVVGRITTDITPGVLKLNPREVEEAFTVPLAELIDPKNLGYTQFGTNFSTPVFLGGTHRIWGLTGLISHMFLKCLFTTEHYNHKIKFVKRIKSVNV